MISCIGLVSCHTRAVYGWSCDRLHAELVGADLTVDAATGLADMFGLELVTCYSANRVWIALHCCEVRLACKPCKAAELPVIQLLW
jgi:hypothetical protein